MKDITLKAFNKANVVEVLNYSKEEIDKLYELLDNSMDDVVAFNIIENNGSAANEYYQNYYQPWTEVLDIAKRIEVK